MTPAETAAARAFRSSRRAALDGKRARPPDLTVSVFARYIRHSCPARGGVSTALELKEHYVFSPEFYVCYCGAVGEPGPDFPPWDCAGKTVNVPAGRFGWIWTQGKCAACGLTALSAAGRLVDPETRPPAEHAVIS